DADPHRPDLPSRSPQEIEPQRRRDMRGERRLPHEAAQRVAPPHALTVYRRRRSIGARVTIAAPPISNGCLSRLPGGVPPPQGAIRCASPCCYCCACLLPARPPWSPPPTHRTRRKSPSGNPCATARIPPSS